LYTKPISGEKLATGLRLDLAVYTNLPITDKVFGLASRIGEAGRLDCLR
jgi:hypothetical protein